MASHVVHIEDEGPLREILHIAFKTAEPQLKITQFASGDEAMPFIKQHGPDIDLFIMDIGLPGHLNGLQIAQQIREMRLHGFIVLTSGYGSLDRSLLKALDCEFLPKPWYIPDLIDKLPRYALSNRPMKSIVGDNSAPLSDSKRYKIMANNQPDLNDMESETAKAETCPGCGTPCKSNALYCPRCGMIFGNRETVMLSSRHLQPTAARPQTGPLGQVFARALRTLVLEIEGEQISMPIEDCVVMGRHSESEKGMKLDVDLSHFQALAKGVSRRHVLISRKGELVYVTDLNTTNGTFLNGQRLAGQTERLLRDGDELKLGQLRLKVHF